MGTTFQGQYDNGKTKINDVYITSDYSVFKISETNRCVNPAHVERLKYSLSIRHVMMPIVVNQNYVVIDGQHRLEACKALGLPIPFIVVAGGGDLEIQLLNSVGKTWTKKDFLEYYTKMGYPHYVQMTNFMNRYPSFTFAACEVILTQNTGGANNTTLKNFKVNHFQTGKFVIKDLQFSETCAKHFIELVKYNRNLNQIMFFRAIMTLMQKPQFDIYQCLDKFSKYGKNYISQTSVEGSIRAIEQIYNFKSRNPVSLVY